MSPKNGFPVVKASRSPPPFLFFDSIFFFCSSFLPSFLPSCVLVAAGDRWLTGAGERRSERDGRHAAQLQQHWKRYRGDEDGRSGRGPPRLREGQLGNRRDELRRHEQLQKPTKLPSREPKRQQARGSCCQQRETGDGVGRGALVRSAGGSTAEIGCVHVRATSTAEGRSVRPGWHGFPRPLLYRVHSCGLRRRRACHGSGGGHPQRGAGGGAGV